MNHPPLPIYGRHRLDSIATVYVLLPPTAHGAWAESLAAAVYDRKVGRFTIGTDPDEAALFEGGRIILAVNSHEWGNTVGRQGLKWFYQANYELETNPNLEYYELNTPSPPQLYLKMYDWEPGRKSKLWSRLVAA